jgi:hypothetical protein
MPITTSIIIKLDTQNVDVLPPTMLVAHVVVATAGGGRPENSRVAATAITTQSKSRTTTNRVVNDSGL